MEKIGKISRVDLFLWVGNFFSVIFCGIIIGFIIGFCLLLITLAYSSLLGTSEISKTDSRRVKGFTNRLNSGLNGLWIPGTVTVFGPLNFVTIEQLVDLLQDKNEIGIIDLSKTSHIDYIAMQRLKDLLANDEQASEDADNDQSHEKDDQSDENNYQLHDNDDVIDEAVIKVILPMNCSDAVQEFFTDANILIVNHNIE